MQKKAKKNVQNTLVEPNPSLYPLKFRFQLNQT